MIRAFTLVLSSVVAIAACPAADWSDIAFPVKNHEFGTVAVASKTEFRFPVVNTMSNTMHIQSVRASCGCTTPIVENQYIAPGETGSILARFNTDTFKGKKGATLTVVIDQPFFAEVRLKVGGYIRSDMVFFPGSIDFAKIAQGEPNSKSTQVLYAGRGDWQIVDVRSNKPWLMPSVKQTVREGGRVNYLITVDVREDAPTGEFQDELVVTTNDKSMPKVPLKVTGKVDSPLSISPQAITAGSIKMGESFTSKLVLLGQAPFQVESITAPDWKIDFEPTTEAKKMHIVRPTLTYIGQNAGPQKVNFSIKTAGEASVTAKGLLTADIRGQ